MSWPLDWPPTYLQFFLIVGLPIMGMVYALLGSVKLQLAERLSLDEAKVGGLVSGFGMMVGPIILVCGFFSDALGRMPIWLFGSTATALAVFILASTRSYAGALVGVCVLGAGWSATVNVGNVLMRVSIPDPEVNMLAGVNFYDFVFGYGAFMAPIVVGFLLRKLGYRGGMILLGVVATVSVVLGAFAEMDPGEAAAPAEAVAEAAEPEKPAAPAPAGEGDASPLLELFGNPLFWVLCLAFLFYVPLESATAGWATTLIVSQDGPEKKEEASRVAARGLLGFWLCFMGSRLLVSVVGEGNLSAFYGEHFGPLMLAALAALCVALMLGFVFLKGRRVAIELVVLAGLVFGPVFPSMMSMLLTTGPGEAMGRAVGFFFFFGSIGWTAIPMLIGRLARRSTIQRGFLGAAASSAVFLVLVLLVFLIAGPTGSS